MRKRFRCGLVLLLIGTILLQGLPVEALEVSAKSAVLMECDTGKILYEKNGEERLPMASTTKIMTTLVALEQGDPERIVTIPPEAVGIEGSSLYLKAGEKMTLLELLTGLMLHSGNDAAMAVAVLVGGSVDGFVQLMNEKARELGLENTSFANPSGLDDELHYTTARELAELTRVALQNPDFAAIVSQYKAIIPYENSGNRYLTNHNKLLRIYDGATGVKTGFTKKSGRCLVSSAQRDGVNLVAVTLAAPDDWNDHERMLDYGFTLTQHLVLNGEGEEIYRLPVYNSDVKLLPVLTGQGAELSLLTEDAERLTKAVELPRFVYAPVQQGEVLGTLCYYLDGRCVREVPLIAGGSCGELPTERLSFWEKLLKFFGK